MKKGANYPKTRARWFMHNGYTWQVGPPSWATINIAFTANTGTIIDPDFEVIEFTGHSQWTYLKDDGVIQYHWTNSLTGIVSDLWANCIPHPDPQTVNAVWLAGRFDGGTFLESWLLKSDPLITSAYFIQDGHDTHNISPFGVRFATVFTYSFQDFGVMTYENLKAAGIDANDTAPRSW